MSVAAAGVERDAVHEHARAWQDLRALTGELANVAAGNKAWTPPPLPDPGGAPLAVDNALQRHVAELRRAYFTALAAVTSGAWRTPPTDRRVPFPGTATGYSYAYDRQHTPVALQERLQAGDDAAGRAKGGVLCSSGMAAIDVLLKALAFLSPPRPLGLAALASYFETHTLFRLSAFARAWRRLFTTEELLQSIRDRVPVVFVEPVQYNWRFDVVDWDAVVHEIDASDDPPIVVVDTTLSGRSAHLDAVFHALGRTSCPLLVRVRSGLKLDEEGLELGNLGVLEWWVHGDAARRFERLQEAADAARVVSGMGIGWHEAAALAPAFVLDPARLHAHGQAIFTSNRMLAAQVELRGALFREAVYPAPPWDAPFVLFKLRHGGADEYRRLAVLLRREAERRGLEWIMSGSFGFRTERFETILPTEQVRSREAPEGVLKVACGRYRGERFQRIVELLGEVASFDTLDDAEKSSGARQ